MEKGFWKDLTSPCCRKTEKKTVKNIKRLVNFVEIVSTNVSINVVGLPVITENAVRENLIGKKEFRKRNTVGRLDE